ncbi:hypothetical protein HKD37_19G053655 [Glycine soja]
MKRRKERDSFLLQTIRSLRHWTLKRSQVIFDGEKGKRAMKEMTIKAQRVFKGYIENVGPLCPMTTTKKLYPLLAMNPKDVGLLCLVINQEANPASCNEPKERWPLVFSVCNQEDLLLKIVTKSRSLEKIFVRTKERKKIE